jgi:hypothetical protein
MGRYTKIIIILSMLAGCDRVSDTLRYSAHGINQLRTDVVVAYNEVANYHQPAPKPIPQAQLRYCYQFISDIVCYDAAQDGVTTAPLVAIQNGLPGRTISGNDVAQLNYAPSVDYTQVHQSNLSSPAIR